MLYKIWNDRYVTFLCWQIGDRSNAHKLLEGEYVMVLGNVVLTADGTFETTSSIVKIYLDSNALKRVEMP